MSKALQKSDTADGETFVMTPEIKRQIEEATRVYANICSGMPREKAQYEMGSIYAGIRDALEGRTPFKSSVAKEVHLSNVKAGFEKKRYIPPPPAEWDLRGYEIGVGIGQGILYDLTS